MTELLYRDPLLYLERCTGNWDGVSRFDIASPQALYNALGNPQDALPSVLVGGTNGKGSVSSLLAAMVHAAGHRVGHSPSPHLSSVTERCVVNGAPVPPQQFGEAIIAVVEAAQRLGQNPSYFETCVGAAFYEFARQALDWMIIEVGLGGRLDATNTIKSPRASVITSIGFDHMNVLGDTLSAIATEKAGIFRPGVPVFVGAVPEEARETLSACAAQRGAPIEFLGRDFTLVSDGSALSSAHGEIALPTDSLHLLAEHQRNNTALAARVAQALLLPSEAITTGIRTVRWPGRLEHLTVGNRSLLIDGAHNPDGIEALKNYLTRYLPLHPEFRSLTLLLSFLRHKEWETMLRSLSAFPAQKQWLFTTSDHRAAADPSLLSAAVPNSSSYPDVPSALHAALTSSPADSLIVCAGSLYFLGLLRPLLTSAPFRTIIP